MPELFEISAPAKTRPVGLDQNEAHPPRAALLCGPDHDDDQVAHLPVGDEGFLAGYYILVTLAHGAGADALQVASGAGFGHCDGANGLARDHARQPFLLLFGGSVAEQVAAADVVMHGEVGGGAREAGVAEFLDYDRIVPEVAAGAAEFLRHLRAEQPGRAAGVEQRPVDDAGRFPALEIGCDLRRREAPHGFPEMVVLFVVNPAMGQHRSVSRSFVPTARPPHRADRSEIRTRPCRRLCVPESRSLQRRSQLPGPTLR